MRFGNVSVVEIGAWRGFRRHKEDRHFGWTGDNVHAAGLPGTFCQKIRSWFDCFVTVGCRETKTDVSYVLTQKKRARCSSWPPQEEYIHIAPARAPQQQCCGNCWQ